MGVNLAALSGIISRAEEKKVINLLPPGVRIFDLPALLWLNLSRPAKIAGSILWMGVGIAFGAWKPGFRSDLVNFELPAESNQ